MGIKGIKHPFETLQGLAVWLCPSYRSFPFIFSVSRSQVGNGRLESGPHSPGHLLVILNFRVDRRTTLKLRNAFRRLWWRMWVCREGTGLRGGGPGGAMVSCPALGGIWSGWRSLGATAGWLPALLGFQTHPGSRSSSVGFLESTALSFGSESGYSAWLSPHGTARLLALTDVSPSDFSIQTFAEHLLCAVPFILSFHFTVTLGRRW